MALADPDAAAQAAEAWTDGEVLAGPDGIVTLITEAGCDLVLNGIVGSAGLVPTVAALGEGIDLALANKESLVVGGELVTQLSEATGAAIIPVDSEHSALHQLLAAERPGTVLKLILTASGRPVPRPQGPRAGVGHGRAGARAPHLVDGRQDHHRLGHADEQGPGADRGPPPVRHPVCRHRRDRAPAVDHPQPHPAVRRGDAGPPRISGHAGPHRLRAALPRARRRAGAGARPGRARRAHLRARRHRHLRLPAPGARRPGSRAAPRRARSTPPTRSRCTRSWAAVCASSRSPR